MRLILFCLLFSLSACSQLISSAKKDFADDLAATIMETDDPETVRQAIPTYLVLVSSMIRGDQENIGLLLSGSKLYGAYASVFVDDTDRKRLLADRAFGYASRAFCLSSEKNCGFMEASYYEYEQMLASLKKEDAELLFVLGSAWAGQIQANSSDWNAVADLPKVKATIKRVIELDEFVSNGDAHLYMAVMQSFLPPAMGGKPDIAKKHFERALEISEGDNLMVQLLYAEKYARLVFDKRLHDQLLRQVLEHEAEVSDKTLINRIAKSRAKRLLDESDDYF